MATTTLNPYLNFKDNARQAMTFYQEVFGGELTVTTFADVPGVSDDPAESGKVMHAMLVTDGGLTLMGSDIPDRMGFVAPAGFSVSLSGDDDTTLRGYWDRLSADGTVSMPLSAAPWGDTFGMCTDRFGISWLVNILGAGSR